MPPAEAPNTEGAPKAELVEAGAPNGDGLTAVPKAEDELLPVPPKGEEEPMEEPKADGWPNVFVPEDPPNTLPLAELDPNAPVPLPPKAPPPELVPKALGLLRALPKALVVLEGAPNGVEAEAGIGLEEEAKVCMCWTAF